MRVCLRIKPTISLSQMSRVQARLNTLPWREIALLRTISLSQMSRVQARLNTLPWREIALLRTISLSQMSKAKLVLALPWREFSCKRAQSRTCSDYAERSRECQMKIALLRTFTHLTTLPKVWENNVATYKMFQSIGYGCLLKYLYYKLSYPLKYRAD